MMDIAPERPEPVSPRRRRSRRRGAQVAAASVVLAVASVAVLQVLAAPPTSLQLTGGERAPALRLPDLVDPDETVDLADRAGRPAVLNFWASWCLPCRKEMPAFQAVYERLGDRVAFIGVDHQDSRREALDLVAKTGVRYPSGYDPEGNVARAYGLFGMPTTVFISASGEILARRTGEITADELERTINDVLLDP